MSKPLISKIFIALGLGGLALSSACATTNATSEDFSIPLNQNFDRVRDGAKAKLNQMSTAERKEKLDGVQILAKKTTVNRFADPYFNEVDPWSREELINLLSNSFDEQGISIFEVDEEDEDSFATRGVVGDKASAKLTINEINFFQKSRPVDLKTMLKSGKNPLKTCEIGNEIFGQKICGILGHDTASLVGTLYYTVAEIKAKLTVSSKNYWEGTVQLSSEEMLKDKAALRYVLTATDSDDKNIYTHFNAFPADAVEKIEWAEDFRTAAENEKLNAYKVALCLDIQEQGESDFDPYPPAASKKDILASMAEVVTEEIPKNEMEVSGCWKNGSAGLDYANWGKFQKVMFKYLADALVQDIVIQSGDS